MKRFVVATVLLSMLFTSFEGAADVAGSAAAGERDHSHEVHGTLHSSDEQHENATDHEDHFCHCSVHAVALTSIEFAAVDHELPILRVRYDSRFNSVSSPPLLRPPNS
jgi:hypothetical protein